MFRYFKNHLEPLSKIKAIPKFAYLFSAWHWIFHRSVFWLTAHFKPLFYFSRHLTLHIGVIENFITSCMSVTSKKIVNQSPESGRKTFTASCDGFALSSLESKVNWELRFPAVLFYWVSVTQFDETVKVCSTRLLRYKRAGIGSCKQNLKTEAEQSRLKSEYLINSARSGALFSFTTLGVEWNWWVLNIV